MTGGLAGDGTVPQTNPPRHHANAHYAILFILDAGDFLRQHSTALAQFDLAKRGSRMRDIRLLILMALTFVISAHAQTYTESVLYNFSDGSGDGAYPQAGLVMDSAGNLYGVSSEFITLDDQGGGALFKIDTNGNFSSLHFFGGSPTDGEYPVASLTIDKSGNLYGTTVNGGAQNIGYGTVFKLTPSGTYSILHNFGSTAGDGQNPYGPVTLDSAGNLYGTAEFGGNTTCKCGIVFKLSSTGKETILHKFTGGSKDGGNPVANVMRDGLGNLYGTTSSGGNGFGVMFKLTSKNVESILYNFCPDTATCTLGANPNYIARSSLGNFYGIVQGVQLQDGGDGGGIFEFSNKNVESVLYTFCGSCFYGPPMPNGDRPSGALLISGGNLYGTTQLGGAFSTSSSSGGGVVYELTPSGVETILYSFPASSTTDGCYPTGGVIADKAGNLYGTTSQCGLYGYGTVFKLTKN